MHLVTDLLSIAGIAAVGGRSVAEIADRFLEQSALNAPTRLPRETRALIERFLSICRRSRRCGRRTARARDRRQDRARVRRSICSRPAPDFLAARGVDVRAIKFATDFGRGIDYYTGFVFELHEASGNRRPRQEPAGGRRAL